MMVTLNVNTNQTTSTLQGQTGDNSSSYSRYIQNSTIEDRNNNNDSSNSSQSKSGNCSI